MKAKYLKAFLFLSLLVHNSSYAAQSEIKKYQWGNLEVTWANDSRFPLFTMIVYFADGALSDEQFPGGTQAAFNMMSTGTKSFSQKDIAENLEYLALSYSSNVTHEFSTFSLSGPIKNLSPGLKMMCHLFNNAIYPKEEIEKEKKRAQSELKDLIDGHGALAERAFRELTLAKTAFSYPVGGKIKDIEKWKSNLLKTKLNYFNKQVKKRIYLAGPESILEVEKMLREDCGWGEKSETFVRTLTSEQAKSIELAKNAPAQITLVKVPKANQVQIKMGKILGPKDISQNELLEFTSSYLGGGFTSRLMREVRVKRGLTYSISARVGRQKEYGRASVNTFTKNETTSETVTVIRDVLSQVMKGEIVPEDFNRTKDYLVGSYPFRFENTSAYLMQLMQLDHEGKNYDELYNLPEKISALTSVDLQNASGVLFPSSLFHVVLLGPIELLPQLQKLGKVEVKNYTDFL